MIHGTPVPTNASEKNSAVSTADATTEEISGALHHADFLNLLNIKTSNSCATKNAVPEASAIRTSANTIEKTTPSPKPNRMTFCAIDVPKILLFRSVTRNASG